MQHGRFQGRIEDARFVTGRGVYVDDLTLEGMVHGVLARAPMPGLIANLDVSAARAVAGVLGVWSGADLASGGPTHLPCGVTLPGSDGATAFQAARPVLALGRARFTGEGVAFIVAESQAAAREAADLVELDLDEIGIVVEAREARAEGAPAVWDEVPDNIAYVWERGDHAAAEAALAAAPRRVTLESHISRVAINSLEPRGCVGEVVGGRLVLHASTQSPHGLKGALAKVFGVEPADVRVIAPDVGGSFGMKAGVYVEDVLCLHAARALGRPVKWIADRSEAFLSDDHGRDTTVSATLGFDQDGALLGLVAHFDFNIGAYLSGRSLAAGLGNLGGISGVYRIGPTAATAHGVFSNIPTLGPYRGAGRPDATYVIERLVDLAAAELGLDPFELRLRNLIPPEAMPHHTGFMFEYDSGEFAENMKQAAELSGRDGFAGRRAGSAGRGKLRGIGYANPIEVAGGPFVNPGADHARVTVNPDGTALIEAGCMSTGQGLQTMFSELVAGALGIARAEIRFAQGDTDDLPGGRGSGGSAATPTGGSSVTLAVRAVIEKGTEIASEMLEAAVADIAFDAGEFGGAFRVAGTDRSVSLKDVAASRQAGLAGQAKFTPSKVTFPNGCHVCEVEIDPETGSLEVCRYTVVEDVGRVMNLTLLTGQMHGGVAQGAGQSLLERMVYDGDGQPRSGTFMDYAMPRADMMPEIRFKTREVRTAVNPVGAKGVGEAGTVGSMVCVINAVCDALGVAHFEMPATPERVWAALRGARA
ncbi:MAG: xanthine dehydrogenase family protein molybdopterin-binding subunit [Proteobacteria bacterium]|nr:xanthine dehydrogenase family protein molybdopterin-binding subunit [Pseudomonadota bacterium]